MAGSVPEVLLERINRLELRVEQYREGTKLTITDIAQMLVRTELAVASATETLAELGAEFNGTNKKVEALGSSLASLRSELEMSGQPFAEDKDEDEDERLFKEEVER